MLTTLDFWLRPDLRDYPRGRKILIALPLIGILAFSYLWTFSTAPLKFQVLDNLRGTPDEKGNIGDIEWNSNYYDTSLYFENRTDDDYTDLILEVKTDLYIANIARFGKCLDGSVEQAVKFGPSSFTVNGVTTQSASPTGPLNATVPGFPGAGAASFGSYSPGWIIRCDKIRKHDTIQLDLAVVNLTKHIFTILPPQKPKFVEVWAEYLSAGKRKRQEHFYQLVK